MRGSKFFKHFIIVIFIISALTACGSSSSDSENDTDVVMGHIEFLSEEIGTRVAGSEAEAEAYDYVQGEFEAMGFEVLHQEFQYEDEDNAVITSGNVIVVKPGISQKEIIVGAHFDSVEVGKGASDNASGVGLMLIVAERLVNSSVPYTIRFIGFGAEETGFQGADYYVSQMTDEDIRNTIGMINLDTVVGGDKIYAYGGSDEEGWLRDQTMLIAQNMGINLETNPGLNPDYPAGTTGDWSDHAPFKNAGIHYLYLESTNWEIGDQDGYTQTVDHGEIWHTENDTLEFFEAEYPGRIEAHLDAFTRILPELLLTLEVPEAVLASAENVERRRSFPVHRYMRRDGQPFNQHE